jgi:hypothetical protein
MFVEYDETMAHLFKLAVEKDAHGLLDLIQELPPEDPKTKFAIAMFGEATGLKFTIIE